MEMIRKKLKAFQFLSEHKFVHRDLREPTIMFSDSDVKIIDFIDWAGRENQVRYPAYLSSFLWPPGVGDFKIILPEHDEWWVDGCCPGLRYRNLVKNQSINQNGIVTRVFLRKGGKRVT